MVYLIITIAYALIVCGGIRFFQTVRKWDDDARILMDHEIRKKKHAGKHRLDHS